MTDTATPPPPPPGSDTPAPAVDEDDALLDDVEWRESQVAAGQHGQRLDRVLVTLAPEFSRSHLQRLIDRGAVAVGGRAATTASQRLRAGDTLRVQLLPTPQSQAFRPQAMALRVVHEDAHLLVIDKPAGLVVHPAAGHWQGTLLNGLLAHHGAAASLPRAGIVHRLDKDTSGLMVVGKTLPAVTALVRALAARDVRREYIALVHGSPRGDAFSLDGPIGRDPRSRVRMAVTGGGREARTDVTVVAREGGLSALVCRLHTGRTHQIRVHLSHAGHPLVADATYGGAPALGLQRQALHARELAFAHPADAQPMVFRQPPPPDLADAWAQVAG